MINAWTTRQGTISHLFAKIGESSVWVLVAHVILKPTILSSITQWIPNKMNGVSVLFVIAIQVSVGVLINQAQYQLNRKINKRMK